MRREKERKEKNFASVVPVSGLPIFARRPRPAGRAQPAEGAALGPVPSPVGYVATYIFIYFSHSAHARPAPTSLVRIGGVVLGRRPPAPRGGRLRRFILTL